MKIKKKGSDTFLIPWVNALGKPIAETQSTIIFFMIHEGIIVCTSLMSKKYDEANLLKNIGRVFLIFSIVVSMALSCISDT